MSTGRNTARDLVEEAKKRIVLLLVCLFGLSYLMSLTSSSVWVNLPAAASLIIFLRYISLDIDVRRRATACNKLSLVDQSSKKRFVEPPKISLDKSNWKRKVNSPEVEAAIDQFTRHLISEWVTDLWYSRITSDTDGPEELVQIMNDVLGEVSSRAREINLIDLLTRDLINLVCNHLELYRSSQSKIGKEELRSLPIDRHDMQFRLVLAAENKLHPALFSIEAEHKVLQHLMDGLISFTFKPKDLQCSFFRYTARELLSCAVMRPILNLANPRVINEKIESLVLSLTNKADKGVAPSAEAAPLIKPNGPSRISADQFPGSLDRSTVGVELVQFKHQRSATASDRQMLRNGSGTFLQEDLKNSGPNSVGIYNASMLPMRDKPLPPRLDLISGDAQLSYPSSSLPSDSRKVDENKSGACNSGGEWGQVLDKISKRKTQALAPEHFENMWTKGRNYRKKEVANQVTKQVVHNTSVGISDPSCHLEVPSNHSVKDRTLCVNISGKNNASSQHEDVYVAENLHAHTDGNSSTHPPITSYQEKIEQLNREMVEPDSESSYPTEDDENNNVTGLNSPGTRVWDSKNKRNAALSHIRHPLESSELLLAKKSGQGHVRHPRTSRTQSGRKRSRPSNNKIPTWQEVERTSFLLGDGQDILNASKRDANAEESSDDPEMESWGRIHSGAATSSSASSISVSESCYSSLKSPENSLLADSFLKLRPEVLGANIVKSGSGTFAVYSIAVNDVNNNSWSIKRRFRHFEELHRRLKEFPEYNLSLPPKHFLSSGLDVPVIQERCKLLDKYLKKLLELPTISGSIEVWDFLSVDSQTYMFSDSLSIIQTLSVDLDDKTYEKSAKIHSSVEDISGQLFSWGEYLTSAGKDYAVQMNKNYFESDSSRLSKRSTEHNLETNVKKESKNYYQDNSGSDSDIRVRKNASSSTKSDKPLKVPLSGADGLQETPRFPETAGDSTIPSEWVPPNLSVPILDLVDVIFQLQDGGWIRRKAFWIAKQLLQLGMGDAFDDWLIEKIQFLRRGSVIASGIKRVEQILWPDGIFITKHPKRKTPTPVPSPKNGAAWKDNKENSMLTSEQQLEAARRAKFVHELIIDKAPAALVSLVGRKEYERCAQDIYFFLQSPVCLKQLAFELLELLLLAAFPELDDVVRKCHEEKEQFGKFEDKR